MELVFTIAVVHLMACLSPGPDILVVVRNSARHGLAAGLHTTAGILCGVSLQILLGLTGISYLVTRSPNLNLLLALAGASWLLYLGLRGLFSLRTARAGSSSQLDEAAGGRSRSFTSVSFWLQGWLVNLLNPKALLFFIGLYSAMLGPTVPLPIKIACAGAQIAVQAVAFSTVALLTARAGQPLRAWPRLQLSMDAAASLLLIAIGIWIWIETLISPAA